LENLFIWFLATQLEKSKYCANVEQRKESLIGEDSRFESQTHDVEEPPGG
jgi:hypothetical protein